MLAAARVLDITPNRPVWMDGMLRAHRSEGVHDPLFARTLLLANEADLAQAWALVALDLCGLRSADALASRQGIAKATGLPLEQVIVATTHTHGGPAAIGYFNESEPEYVADLVSRLPGLLADAWAGLQPALVGCGAGQETTINHYRRLLADDGHVVMNWEPWPAERIVRPLGQPDTEVGVLRVVALDGSPICTLFNYPCHPNVMSGDNYLLTADFPGAAVQRVEQATGGPAIFINGAQGTMDIDGLKHRDWEGVAQAGESLAESVLAAAAEIEPADLAIRGAGSHYELPGRLISDREWGWAQEVLARTGGKVAAVADGVGDDYLAVLYREMRERGPVPWPVEQTCFAIGDTAFVTFPGEMYTEIGLAIKAQSPFRHTFILGLANGDVGYVPTRRAVGEGGYAEDTRRLDESAEDIVKEETLTLLERVAGNL